MKKLTFLITAFLFINCLSFAQSPDILWSRTYGGTGNDIAESIIQTADSGYVIAGRTTSNDYDVSGNHGVDDYWILKLNSSGDTIWTKTLGGSRSDRARSISQTSDGGYVVAGFSRSNDGDVSGNNGDYDYWIVKLDSSGDIAGTKVLGGSGKDCASPICQTTGGGYVVAGYSMIVKLDSLGGTMWKQTLGGIWDEQVHSICQTTDGGYVAAGYSSSNDGNASGNHGECDFWIVKLDSAGNKTWTKTLGGSSYDKAYSISQTLEGGYVVAGYTNSNDYDVSGNHGGCDYWVVKLNSSGDTTWTKTLGGSHYDNAHSICQTTDGGYVVAGTTSSNDGDVSGIHGFGFPDYWIVKLDSSGDITWAKTLGGFNDDRANSISQTQDGGFVVAGSTTSNDGDVYGHHGSSDYWVVKLAPVPLSDPVELPFTEDWESESGDRNTDGLIYSGSTYSWSFETDLQNEGRVQWGTNTHLSHAGTGALTMDRSPSSAGNYAINYTTLSLNMADYSTSTDLELSFWWADHGDEEHANDKVWVRGSDLDPWIVLYDLNPKDVADDVYQFVSGLDIDATLLAASQTVSSTFQIRFGQEDDYNTDWDGISFDDIVIEEASAGFFTDSNQELGTFGHTDVALGDMDGDGDIDAVVTKDGHDGSGYSNIVWLNNGEGDFTDSGINFGQSESWGIALGDLDGDGDLDGFVANSFGPNKVYLNNGPLTTSNGQNLGNYTSRDVVLGDVDGDGDLDAVIANSYGQPNIIYLNKGNGQFFNSGLYFGTESSWGIALGDMDQDGDLDGFVANDGPNKVYLNEGSTTTDNGQSLGNSRSRDVQLGDMDGDGDLDAVVANGFITTQPNKVWLNDGSGNFSDSGIDFGKEKSMAVALGDLDGDGDLDGFVANNRGPNKIYLNDGLNTTDNGQLLGNSDSYGVALADLDGDGDLDAFVANYDGPCKVWFNQSPPQEEKQAASQNLSQFSINSFEEQKEVLLDNYPNPFNKTTTIRFKLNSKGRVVLRIANLYGKVVEQLYDATAEAGQEYKLEFQAGDLPAGIYVIQLESENGLKAHSKMMLFK